MLKRGPSRILKEMFRNCERKIPFNSLESAELAMHTVIALRQIDGSNCEAYQCMVCTKFHWGHYNPERVKGFVQKVGLYEFYKRRKEYFAAKMECVNAS